MNSRTGVNIGLIAVASTVAAAGMLAAMAFAAGPAAVRAAGPPQITFMFPRGGETFAEPLKVFQFCFASPINVKDLDKGGDFKFALKAPDSLSLGLRIVFQPDGYGVAIYPGTIGASEGEWTFEFRVTDRETLEPLAGAIKYSVAAGGAPIVLPTPAACTADSTPAPPSDATAPGATSPAGDNGTTGGSSHILLFALLTIGVAGAAAVLALIGYRIRNRVGFQPHRPPEGEDGDSESHH